MAAFAALTIGCASEARAECFLGEDDVGYGFVLPSQDCAWTIHTDVAIGAVTEDFRNYGLSGSVESGVLVSIPEHRFFQLGPVVSLGGHSITDDAEQDHSVFEPRLLLRTRLWIPGGGDDKDPSLVYVDAAVGAAALVPTEGADGVRGALYSELGVNLHGGVGLFFSVEPAWSLADGSMKPLYAMGMKTTAAGFLVALFVYLCVESHC